jgi:L-threonylcarbamoyladenylate synthase
MNTKVKIVDKGIVEEAGKVIKDGGLVAFPTETV